MIFAGNLSVMRPVFGLVAFSFVLETFRLFWGLGTLDGLAIRKANLGDSRESIRRNNLYILIRFEPFAPITSNLRFEISSAPKRDPQKNGVQVGNPKSIHIPRAPPGPHCLC